MISPRNLFAAAVLLCLFHQRPVRALEGERWAVPSWGDVVCVYGPGTDASLDSPEAMEKTIHRWIDRGFTGVTLRTDLADYEPMIHRNNNPKQNPRLQLLLDYVDHVSARFKVLETTQKISEPLGFRMWAWHPHLYSDGATGDIGTPGLGRMIPWSYCSRYFIDHPEGITVDRQGNQLWMVREYAYPEARATKVAEFVHMARTLGLKNFIACMRSEVNQLVDPPAKGDQYGFNAPVVAEMKSRHGVDILTDARFDAFSPDFKIDDPMVENWRTLRGEHITEFYRELRKGLDEVDPEINIAVTLSGESAGPPIGNQKLDWRSWVDEGLIDAIIAPVFFEATLDPEATSKGYTTHVRAGIGSIPFPVIKDYIKKSPHPEIEVISSGCPPYFLKTSPPGTDGWRCDVWYELYTSAWYQRWSQWMEDVKDFGSIRFLEQNFDSFPVDPAHLPPAGSLGGVAHDPKLRACPGGWYPFGDAASGNAQIQNAIRRGESGHAVKLTSNGSEGPGLTGYHASDADRSNISAVLDTSITNGTCRYTFWIYRDEGGGVTTYLENRGGELDVGLRIAADTGEVSYTTGRSPGGTGTWVATGRQVPAKDWSRFAIDVDFAKASYSVSTEEFVLARDIPYTPPPPRTTMQNGVNIEIPVPSYKAFRQVLFQPLGAAGKTVYLDDVSVNWQPDLAFTPAGEEVIFADDFEKNSRDQAVHGLAGEGGGTWEVEGQGRDSFRVITSTSYRHGAKSVLAAEGGDLRLELDEPVVPVADSTIIFDADLFIRSSAPSPGLIPGLALASHNQVSLVIESDGNPVACSTNSEGKWRLGEGGREQETGAQIPYDCWMHVQLSIDLKSRTVTAVHQQIGQVAQKIGTTSLPTDFEAGKELQFLIRFGQENDCVVLDNVRITMP